MEVVVVDSGANVACFDALGNEIWHRQISGFSAQNPVVGDINGDLRKDIVVATTSGFVWALDGSTGKDVEGFPVKTGGRILSPVLLVDLVGKNHLQLVVPSFDGRIYIIDGINGCADMFDLGENSYTQVLADDVTGDGRLDLLVSTMNGNLFLLNAYKKFHPLDAWSSMAHGLNGFSATKDYGVFVHDHSRRYRDIQGSNFNLQFEIVDRRSFKGPKMSYFVEIFVMDKKVFQAYYKEAGVKSETIDCPNTMSRASVVVRMTNEHGIRMEDRFAVTFNMHFYKTMKWIIVIPFTLMAGVLTFVKNLRTPLPT
eukprot:GFYU01005475.1.p1 GENE.GFYU01005475.1~~GFYU01005475.1.p1  ORF type:complete len:322 (+),score=113.50 GFYU01005475.1:32-967(+)